MKRFISTLLAGLGVFAALAFAAAYADARPYGGGHRGGGYYHGGGARVGVYVGVSPWLYPRPYWGYGYGYPYAYGPYGYYGAGYAGYYPTVVEQPVVYTEQAQSAAPPSAAAPQAQQQFWFFCQDTQTYYPHAQNCATPWQRVIPHAPQ
jgi:hypothetical protein